MLQKKKGAFAYSHWLRGAHANQKGCVHVYQPCACTAQTTRRQNHTGWAGLYQGGVGCSLSAVA